MLVLGLVVILALRAGDDDGPAPAGDDPVVSTRDDGMDPAGPPEDDVEDTGAEPTRSPVLQRALLTSADLPAGYVAMAPGGAGREICPGQDPTRRVRPAAFEGAAFQQGGDGPVVASYVWEFPSAPTASSFLAASATSMDACGGGAQGTYRFERTAVSVPGDEVLAARFTADGVGAPAEGHLVYVRAGARVVTVTAFAVGDVDDGLAARLAARVLERL